MPISCKVSLYLNHIIPERLAMKTYLHSQTKDIQAFIRHIIHHAGKLFHCSLADLVLGEIMNVGHLERRIASNLALSVYLLQASNARLHSGKEQRALTSAINFSFSSRAFSEPCIATASLRILKGGLARS